MNAQIDFTSKNSVILEGDVLDVLKTLESESVQCCITSPPYYGLRNYGTDPLAWGGDSNCQHNWTEHIQKAKGGHNTESNPPSTGNDKITQFDANNPRFGVRSSFCQQCNAWRGELGLEPTFDCQRDRNSEIELREDLTETEREEVIREMLRMGLIR